MKRKISLAFVFALALLLIAAAAVAAVSLSRSPEMESYSAARKALMDERGMSQEMARLFTARPTEQNGETTYVFRTMGSEFMKPERIGEYTVTLGADGKASVSWSFDGADPALYADGDLTSSIWGVKALEESLARYHKYVAWQAENNGIYTLPLAEQEARFAELYAAVAPLTLLAGPIDPATVTPFHGGDPTPTPAPTDPAEIAAMDAAKATAKRALLERAGGYEPALRLFDASVQRDPNGSGGWLVTLTPSMDLLNCDQTGVGDTRWGLFAHLGDYAVTTDAAGDTALSFRWSLEGTEDDSAFTETTWGGATVYSARMLPWICKLTDACRPITAKYPDIQTDWFTVEDAAAYDALLRAVGFNAERYSAALPKAGDLTAEQAKALALEAMRDEYGETDEKLAQYVIMVGYSMNNGGMWRVGFYGAEGMGNVDLRASDGLVLEVWLDSGATSNG